MIIHHLPIVDISHVTDTDEMYGTYVDDTYANNHDSDDDTDVDI